MFYPQNAVLVFIESRKQGPLKAVHQTLFCSLWNIFLFKRQHAGRVLLAVLTRINQGFDLVGISPQKRSALTVSLIAKQVVDGAGTPASAALEHFNDHAATQHLAPSLPPPSATKT